MLFNNASGHSVVSFLDGHASYNQIFMVEEDMTKWLSVVLILLVYLNGYHHFWFKEC
jgi:hypothetical protein